MRGGPLRSNVHLLCRLNGSVFPRSFAIALPVTIITAIFKTCDNYATDSEVYMWFASGLPINASAFSTFTSMLGFLVIFRSSQAYSRFWEGSASLMGMFTSYYDAACFFFACCEDSKAEREKVVEFQNMLVRLMSLLYAVSMAHLLGENVQSDTTLEVIDVEALDEETLQTLKAQNLNKVELLFLWVERLCTQAIRNQILDLPPPITTRAFQLLGAGMQDFHSALRIVQTPFPFPYSQVTLMLLVIHWMVTPLVMTTWTSSTFMAALFSFCQVFILWALYDISVRLEDPFGTDDTDLKLDQAQKRMNDALLLLMQPEVRRLPGFRPQAAADILREHQGGQQSEEGRTKPGEMYINASLECSEKRLKFRRAQGYTGHENLHVSMTCPRLSSSGIGGALPDCHRGQVNSCVI